MKESRRSASSAILSAYAVYGKDGSDHDRGTDILLGG